MKKFFGMVLILAFVAVGCSNTTQTGGAGGSSALRVIAEAGYSTPEEASNLLKSLRGSEAGLLYYYSVTMNDLMRLACQTNNALTWKNMNSTQGINCAQNDISIQQAMGFGGYQNNLSTNRLSLLTHLKCLSGEIDKGTCGTYMNVQGEVNQGTGEAVDLVIGNIGGNCIVGKDPGCVQG